MLDDGLVSRAETVVLTSGLSSPPVGSVARTAALAYENAASARSAIASAGTRALEQCLAAVVNHYVDPGPGDERTTDSFATTSRPVSGLADAILIESTFDEEVVGGHDSTENVDLFVGRAGPIVVTVIVAESGQNLEPESTAYLTRRLGRDVMKRTTASR